MHKIDDNVHNNTHLKFINIDHLGNQLHKNLTLSFYNICQMNYLDLGHMYNIYHKMVHNMLNIQLNKLNNNQL
jgi:hypothetical protein